MKIAIKVLTEWDRENVIPFFEKYFPNCNKYDFTINGAAIGECYVIINGGLELVDEYNNKHLDLSDYTILQGVPENMELPSSEPTKTREQELEECLSNFLKLLPDYGDNNTEEWGNLINQAKQLLNK